MTDTSNPREVIFYIDGNGKEPFTIWHNSLRDKKARRRILTRVRKMEQSIYGDHKPLGDGISELRFFWGPGYRVYFGEHGKKTVVLLGGDKDDQQNDIQRAKDYWWDYKNHEEL